MRVSVVLEHRFDRTPDGRVWTQAMFPASFWQRYLSVFGGVRVVARTREVAEVPADYQRADGPGIELFEVPYYLGPAQYLRKARQVQASLRGTLDAQDAFIFRVSSQLASHLTPQLTRARRPFALEVVCDPWDVFSPGAARHPLRPWFRRRFAARLRAQCRQAAAVAYVTREALQARYPASSDAFTSHYSSVELPAEAYAAAPRQDYPDERRVRIVSVGSLAAAYKGVDVLIESVARCIQNGLDAELVILGDGLYRSRLEQQATRAGCGDRIQFRGQLRSGSPVWSELDKAHLFVLASRAEGLPRAMVEAMARGLPCLGTKIGGIPELLQSEDLVDVDAVAQLADRIQQVAQDPGRWQRMSERNWERALEYRDDWLQARRVEFYEHVRGTTQCWQRGVLDRRGRRANNRPVTTG